MTEDEHQRRIRQTLLARATSQPAAALVPRQVPEDPARCERCGDDRFTTEFGCVACGHGKKGLLQRSPWLVSLGTSGAFGLVGVLGLFTVGRVSAMGPILNVVFLAMSMVFSGLGTRVLQAPTAFSIASVDHHDAWGQAHYGPSRKATEEEGRTNGAVSVAVGLLMLLIGIFLGHMVP